MELHSVAIEIPKDANVVIGQSHFIKTAEDLYEAMVNSVPGAKFGAAFCEASGPALIRVEGNDDELMGCASKNALAMSAGHTFIVIMQGCFPLNVIKAIRDIPEVCTIFCATANPLDVIIAENERGRGIMGVIDGDKSKGIEDQADKEARKEFLRKIGYKR